MISPNLLHVLLVDWMGEKMNYCLLILQRIVLWIL